MSVRGTDGPGRSVLSSVSAGWERDFTRWVEGQSTGLRNTAYLLCGDWQSAEDLTQTTLIKLYLAWRRIDRSTSVNAYARRTLVRVFLDEGRRPWRRERPSEDVPDHPAAEATVDDRLTLEQALRRLPRTQRAVLVLRFWSDLDVRTTAEVLSMSPGTVKSATARGLAALQIALTTEGSQ